jgi:hypothetical protein
LENYRMDSRTKEQFIQDIKVGNERERLAITLFKSYLRREFGFTGSIDENGVDMSGDFIEDVKQVTTGADYKVNGKPLEVKTSTGHNTNIYLKVKQLDAYIRQGASILYVNGIERDFPAFTFWTVEDLKEMKATLEKETPPNNINGGKLSYKVDALKYEWRQFNGKEKKYVRY